jgi:two-component system response regulator CpxR
MWQWAALCSRRARQVHCGSCALKLTSIEFDILEVLMRSAGRTVSRDELSAALHQRRATPYERSLDVHISHLRKKLERTGCSIRAVRGAGYHLAAAQL